MMSVKSTLPRILFSLPGGIFLLAVLISSVALAAPRFTEKQIEALQRYIGKTYWIAAEIEGSPLFFSSPSPKAAFFPVAVRESFQITELLKGSTESLYYRAQFASGKEAYLSVDGFLEELNSTLMTQDPNSGQNRKTGPEAESKRDVWIRSRPWPENVKEAAVKRQAILGMNMGEVRVALGKPNRIIRLKSVGAQSGRQEQWVYPQRSVLTFADGVLILIHTLDAKSE